VEFFAANGETGILGFISSPDEAEVFFGAGASIIRLWERDVAQDRVALLQALGAEVWATSGGRGTAYDGGDTSAQNLAAMAAVGIRGVLINDVVLTRTALEGMQ